MEPNPNANPPCYSITISPLISSLFLFIIIVSYNNSNHALSFAFASSPLHSLPRQQIVPSLYLSLSLSLCVRYCLVCSDAFSCFPLIFIRTIDNLFIKFLNLLYNLLSQKVEKKGKKLVMVSDSSIGGFFFSFF